MWLERAHAVGGVYSSVLLELELVRVLRRERLPVEWAGNVLDRVGLVSVDDGVLRSAAAIEPHIRSLDAIHLATCALLGNAVTLATHDAHMQSVARVLGRDVVDPLDG